MSSSCAWYKLFETRRLIFHVGNPIMGTRCCELSAPQFGETLSPKVCIAGNFRRGQIFAIFVDRPASAKIWTSKKLILMTSLVGTSSTHVNEMVLYTVCPLNGCCKEDQPPTVRNTNEPVRNAPKISVGVWSERPAFRENKNCENFFWRVWRLSAKICTSENFPLYGRRYVIDDKGNMSVADS